MSYKHKGRPKLKHTEIINKGFKISQEMVDQINAYAKENNLTFSKVVKLALDEFFKK